MSNFMNAKNIIEACNRQMKQIKEKQQAMQECEELYDLEDTLLLLECTVNLLASPRFTEEEREAISIVCSKSDEYLHNYRFGTAEYVKLYGAIATVRAMLTDSEIADKGKG